MNKRLFFFMILLVIILNINVLERFDINSDNQNTDIEATYKSDKDNTKPIYYNKLDYQPKQEINCCLIEKKYLPEFADSFGGNFKYTFEELKNENCNIDNYRLDNNKQLFIDGYNNWSNKYCNKDKTNIGSCRNINKECIDFVNKDYCNKYKMVWSNKTCQNPLEYIWIDKVKFKKPIPENDGAYIMFNKETKF